MLVFLLKKIFLVRHLKRVGSRSTFKRAKISPRQARAGRLRYLFSWTRRSYRQLESFSQRDPLCRVIKVP